MKVNVSTSIGKSLSLAINRRHASQKEKVWLVGSLRQTLKPAPKAPSLLSSQGKRPHWDKHSSKWHLHNFSKTLPSAHEPCCILAHSKILHPMLRHDTAPLSFVVLDFIYNILIYYL